MIFALVDPCCAAMRLPAMDCMPLIGLPFLHEKLRAGGEEGQTEINLVAPRLRVGHGFGDQIDGVGRQKRDSRLRRRFFLFQFDLFVEFLD